MTQFENNRVESPFVYFEEWHVERFAGACGISLFTISSSAYGNLVIAPRLEHAPDFLRAMLLIGNIASEAVDAIRRQPSNGVGAKGICGRAAKAARPRYLRTFRHEGYDVSIAQLGSKRRDLSRD